MIGFKSNNYLFVFPLVKIWEKNLEDCTTHKLLNFEEQLRSLCLESECIKNTDEDEKS